MTFIYLGFECQDNLEHSKMLLVSCFVPAKQDIFSVDFRNPDHKLCVLKFVEEIHNAIWVCRNAQVDLYCLEQCGVDTRQLNVIDASAESRMLTLTNPSFAQQLDTHEQTVMTDWVKSLKNRSGEFTVIEWRTFKIYVETEIRKLPKVLDHIWGIHHKASAPVALQDMLLRGKYQSACSYLLNKSRGIPVDSVMLTRVFANKTVIIQRLQQAVNEVYGKVYVCHPNSQFLQLDHNALANYISKINTQQSRFFSCSSPHAPKNLLKEISRQYPELAQLYQTDKTINALYSPDLTPLLCDGYIKPHATTFNQKTGRNSPRPSRGFMFNLPPAIRSFIKPQFGNVLIGADWSQQEIGIAAALSGDRNYQAIYNAADGDVYIELAKLAGAVSKNATRESNPFERRMFKGIQLGIGYGKGFRSLANDIYRLSRQPDGSHQLSFAQSIQKAEEILSWHMETFSDYWQWSDSLVAKARRDGYISSVDGWIYYVSDQVRDNQIKNFPMQANGAAMMRRAVIYAAQKDCFDLICTHHDALYANAAESNQVKVSNEIIECMNLACNDILNGSLQLRIDMSVYDATHGYQDDRGTQVRDLILDQLKY